MINRPSAAALVALVLVANLGQASGFVAAKRRHHSPSSGARQSKSAAHAGDYVDSGARLVPALDALTLAQESSSSFQSSESRTFLGWALRKPSTVAKSGEGEHGAEAVVQPKPGMETQLGGWSYARTVLTNRRKAKDRAGGDDGADGSSSAGSASAATQSAGSGGGGQSSSDAVTGDKDSGDAAAPKETRAGGGKMGQGGDDDGDSDDDDDDEGKGKEGNGGKDEGQEEQEGKHDGLSSWDLSEFGDSQDGVSISFSDEGERAGAEAAMTSGSAGTSESSEGQEGGAPQEYEVVCDGDVCERKPVGTVQTVAGTPAAVDAADAALAAAGAAAGDGGGVEGQEGAASAAATEVDDADEVDSSSGTEDAAGDAGDAATSAEGVAGASDDGAVGESGGDGAAGVPEGGGEGDGGDGVPSPADNPDVAQLVSMGWELEESAAALAQSGGDVVKAAEALAAQEEADLERYEEGLADLQQRGWDSDVAMSAMREAGGNSTAALLALEEEDRMLSVQFEQSIEEMVEHGWDEEVARKALLMQWQKDIEGGGGSRKAQKQFEKTVKGVHAKGVKEGKTEASSGGGSGGGSNKEKNEPPAPTPAKREDVVFEVTDKTLQKVVLESPVPVILDVYAEWCGPCKQLTPALEDAAIRSGGMFRVAKVDAEKQKGIAEVLGIKAFPSIFGVKDGIILDNFVGVLPQDEMQAFMMGVVMGVPPPKDKELREHQKGQSELRGISRKLAHVSGLAVLGSRKKESLCIKVDKALSEMLTTPEGSTPATEDPAAVAAAKKAARTVITVLMSAYKFPEDPKYRSLSTTSKMYEDVLAPHPPMLEALRLAGFRHKDGDESHLTLLHRNMAVLASVQDRVEVWNKSVKMPEVNEEDSEEYDSDEEDEEELERQRQVKARLAKVAKLEITDSSGSHETVVKMEMEAESTMGELFEALQENEGFGDDLVLVTTFPKRELAASDPSCRSSTLLSLGLAPSARLTATTAAALAAAAEKEADGEDAEAAALLREGLKAKMMDKSRDSNRKGSKKAGSLFGASDGIIEVKKGKHQEYFGGDSTVTLAAEDTEEEAEDGGDKNASAEQEDDFGQPGEEYVTSYSDEEGSSSSSDERGHRAAETAAVAAATSEIRGEDEGRFLQQQFEEDSDRESDGEREISASEEFSSSENEGSGGESSVESDGEGSAGSSESVGQGAGGSYDVEEESAEEEDEGSYDVESGDEYDDDEEEEGFVGDGSVSYDDSYSGEEEGLQVEPPVARGRQREGEEEEGEGSSYDDEDVSYDDDDDVDSYYDQSFSSDEGEGGGGQPGSQGRPKDKKRF